MIDQAERARIFADLHIKGDPLIIYNVWDGGSAKTVAGCGAKAIATGDHPVGYAHGYGDDDFDDFSFDTYLLTIKEIASRVGDLPFSVDISNGQGLSLEELKARVKTVLDAGAIGINFEDRLPDSSGVLPIDEQVEKLTAIRAAADEYGVPLFINARTDLFSTSEASVHASLIDEAIQRAEAYKAAGANGLFVPKLNDIELITRLCGQSVLPVNIIRLPGAPSTSELASAGVSRVSYGPVPRLEMTEWLKQKATAALQGEV